MRTLILIQARLQSVRLPGKMLADLGGKTLLEHVVTRASRARYADRVIVATGRDSANNPLYRLCRERGWSCYRGSDLDVLDRLYQSALADGADVVVRVTGDCPLVDPALIDGCIRLVRDAGADYASNFLPPESWPDGTDTEAVSFAALERAWERAQLPSDREHVTPWIRRCPTYARVSLVHEPDLSGYRLCIDEQADLDVLRALMALSPAGPDLGWREAVRLLDEHPEIRALNAHLARNASYLAQLEKEKERV